MLTVEIKINEKSIHKFCARNINGKAVSTYEVWDVTDRRFGDGLQREEPDVVLEHWRKDGAIELAKSILERFT